MKSFETSASYVAQPKKLRNRGARAREEGTARVIRHIERLRHRSTIPIANYKNETGIFKPITNNRYLNLHKFNELYPFTEIMTTILNLLSNPILMLICSLMVTFQLFYILILLLQLTANLEFQIKSLKFVVRVVILIT